MSAPKKKLSGRVVVDIHATLYAICVGGGKAEAVPVRLLKRGCRPTTEHGSLQLKNCVEVVGVTIERPGAEVLKSIFNAWASINVDPWLAQRNLRLYVHKEAINAAR